MYVRCLVLAAVLLVAATVALGGGLAAGSASTPPIRINEFMADNDASAQARR